jgi:hypothetical protein
MYYTTDLHDGNATNKGQMSLSFQVQTEIEEKKVTFVLFTNYRYKTIVNVTNVYVNALA